MTEKPPKSLVGPLRARKMKKATTPRITRTTPKTEKAKLYRLATGTPNELTANEQNPPQEFPSSETAKTAAIRFFQEQISWCNRFNKPGLAAIDQAITTIEAMPEVLKIPRTVTCLLDEYTNFRLAVTLWKVDPPKKAGTT